MTVSQPRADDIPGDQIRRILDLLPMAVLVIDAESRILRANERTGDFAPLLLGSGTVREGLAGLAHEQKLDRLLLRHEIITCPGEPGGPNLYWRVWEEPLAEGRWVLFIWENDWTDAMHDRRAAFTMAASHELRTPLAALIGFAELLEMEDTSNLRPQQLEAVRTIAETANHLSKLVEDIFELTANSFGELRLQLERVDAGELVRSTVDALRPEVENRGATLSLEAEPDLPEIEVDPARVRQMLGNLIRNAAVHNGEGTSISVELWSTGTTIGVLVADDGDGLPFADPESAFSSFQRGGSSRGDRAGSGIGLTITKRLIELHRGTIEVRSETGAGTAFTLWFPVDRASAITPGTPGPA